MDDAKSSPNVSDAKSNSWFEERPAGEERLTVEKKS
jgi:hypothetical protein